MSAPRWYLPEGIAAPAHLPPRLPRFRVVRGPDGGKGVVLGGIIEPDEPGWLDSGAGWWVNLEGCTPADLARQMPYEGEGLTHGALQWHVPRLVQPGPAGTLVAAGERIRTMKGWALPIPLRIPTDAALALARRWMAGDIKGTEAEVERVALLALGLNYHLTLPEVVAGGWWSERLPLRVVQVALSVPVDEVSHG